MKAEKLKIEKKGIFERGTFYLKAPPHLANALRRILLSEIKVLAIEDVKIELNDSALYDGVLAHRLGLIPIKTPKGVTEAEFEIDAEGPSVVYSKDLESKTKGVEVALKNIPLTYLKEGTKLKAKANAILGNGKEHMKWQAGLAAYQEYPIVKIDKRKADYPIGIAECPRKVFGGTKSDPKVENLENCNLCMACVRAVSDDSIIVEGEKDHYIFTLESFGQKDVKTLLREAGEILTEAAKEVTNLKK